MTETTRTIGRRRDLPATTDEPKAAPISGIIVKSGDQTETPATAGWGAYDRVVEQNSDYAQYLKIGPDPTVIKVIDAAPFDNFVCHWVDEITEGSKSIRCWGTHECPLCRYGDKPKKFSVCFNVISLEDPENPALKIWEAGVKIARTLKDISLDKKRGPLNRADLYFSISKTQKSQKQVEYQLERVRAEFLDEEYGVQPLTDAQLALFAADRVTEPVKQPLSAAAMREVVDLLMAD